MHQSVKDLIAEKSLLVLNNRLMSADEGVRVAHLGLCRICIRYLAIGEMGYSDGYKYNPPPPFFGYPLLRNYVIESREAFLVAFRLKPLTGMVGVRRLRRNVNLGTAILRYH